MDDALLDTLDAALLERYPDLERLERRPRRDDGAFGARGVPGGLPEELDAWLYAPSARVAFAVLLGDAAQLGECATPQRAWQRLMAEHLHAAGAGREWTGLSSVAMPVLPPFDEPGLRVTPVLALEPQVSPAGAGWLSDVMVATVRAGHPHVVPMLVFSAAAFRPARADYALSADRR